VGWKDFKGKQFVFIKYLLLLIIFDHYKEYSLIKEARHLEKIFDFQRI